MAVPDYYEILAVRRDANTAEVNAAYNRWIGHFKKDTSPPEPRRQALLEEARDVLVDPERRKAFERELAEQLAEVGKKVKRKPLPVAAIAGAVVVVLGAGGAWLAMRSPAGGAAPKGKSVEQLQMAASGAVSPVVAYDISGKSSPVGLGVVVEDKVMVAPCRGLPPGAQLMVQAGTRQVGARVTNADEALGLCRLLTDSYVGEPLPVSPSPPAAGARLFAAVVDAKGEVGLKEVSVNAVVDTPEGKAIRAAGATLASGTPLLDAQGKVVAVATTDAAGAIVHRHVPSGWLAENRPRVSEPRPYQGTEGGASPGPAAAAGAGAGGEEDASIKAMREEGQRKIEAMPPGPARDAAARLQAEREKAVRQQMKIIEGAEK